MAPVNTAAFEHIGTFCKGYPIPLDLAGNALVGGTCSSVLSLSSDELASVEVAEARQVEALDRELERILAKRRCHEQRRHTSARELRRRELAASPLGRALADLVLPYLTAGEVARLFASSPATLSGLCWYCDPCAELALGEGPRRRVHHLRRVAATLSAETAELVVARLYWPAVWTMAMDLGSPGWEHLLEALESAACRQECSRAHQPELQLCGVRALSVAFPAERSVLCLQRWFTVSPLLVNFMYTLASAPLQELDLTNLRSTNILTAALRSCGRHLRVCKASFLGPESKRGALELPESGLPALQCFWIHHRDFSEQRASRQDRMRIPAAGLLACLKSVREPKLLRVLTLSGVQIDGSAEETASLLHGLLDYPNFAALSLRFSVPSTFRSLLPLRTLLQLRQAWQGVGAFFLRETSLHGFDYWPVEHEHDFERLYPRGKAPDAFQVFDNEFCQVLRSQYATTAEQQWRLLSPTQRSFWGEVASNLQVMQCSEVRQRIAQLFPGSF